MPTVVLLGWTTNWITSNVARPLSEIFPQSCWAQIAALLDLNRHRPQVHLFTHLFISRFCHFEHIASCLNAWRATCHSYGQKQRLCIRTGKMTVGMCWRKQHAKMKIPMKRARICGLKKMPSSIEAGLIQRQQMLLVSCGVGWNRNFCYWRCLSAELQCVS